MKPGYTHIAVVLDRSGSMQSVRADTIGAFNAFIGEQQKAPGEATLTLAQFDNEYETLVDFKPLAAVEPLTEKTFVPRGNTALWDAIGRTVVTVGEKLAALPEGERPVRVVVAILTDGHENASKEYRSGQVAEMIAHQREKYGWEFAFMGTTEAALTQAESVGIARGSMLSFAATGQGVQEAGRSLSNATSRYRAGGASAGGYFNGEDGAGSGNGEAK